MSDYEMPVMIRFSVEELAAALGRAPDDAELAMIGGFNAVLHPIDSERSTAASAALAETDSAAHQELQALEAKLKPIEEQLFQRMRSSPQIAKDFFLDPIGTMEELGLIDGPLRAEVEAHRAALQSLFKS